ncbi:CPBP family intramembrane glutamic endopeptidase [Trueperella pyogenes]|uniref:CPBP family intramembrane glutamic endopeptidase n=1 Tax=Trueperella pyogenes TaxID=1661 RepID=UPI00345DD41E
MNKFEGVKYSDPAFIQHFIWLVLAVVVCALLYYFAFQSETALPVERSRDGGVYLLAIVPVGITLIATMFAASITSALLITFLGALLVGIGEEIVFRHIFFGALLTQSATRGKTVTAAILTSALVFSVVHAVNVFGGQSVAQVSIQLGTTFLLGIVFAGLYLNEEHLEPHRSSLVMGLPGFDHPGSRFLPSARFASSDGLASGDLCGGIVLLKRSEMMQGGNLWDLFEPIFVYGDIGSKRSHRFLLRALAVKFSKEPSAPWALTLKQPSHRGV